MEQGIPMPEDMKDQPRQKDVIKVLVSIPNEGHTHVEAYANRMANFQTLGIIQGYGIAKDLKPRFVFHQMTVGRALTPLAREEAADYCLAHDYDYLYMIDDDMICPNDLFMKLYRHDVDLVGALAFTRNYPHRAVMYQVTEGWDDVTKNHYYINHYILKYPRNKLVQCDAIGFGAVLIKADALRKVQKPRFMTTASTGEDIFFCNQLRKVGGKIFMDTSAPIGHLSHPVNITEQYVDAVHASTKEIDDKKNPDYDPKKVSEPKGIPDLILGGKWE